MSALPPLDVMLWCVLALLATGVAAIVIGRNAWERWPVYCACLAISGIACAFALLHLIVHPAAAWEAVLPLGLPGSVPISGSKRLPRSSLWCSIRSEDHTYDLKYIMRISY